MKRYSRMFIDLAIGIFLCGIITEIFVLVFTDRKVYCSIGLLVGMIYALYTLFGINESVETAVLMTENEALKHTKVKYIIRVVVLIILLILFWVFDFGSPITFIIGAFLLKFSTYMQPLIDKVVGKYVE